MITNLETEVETQTTAISNLQIEVTNLISKVEQVNSKVSGLESKVTALEKELQSERNLSDIMRMNIQDLREQLQDIRNIIEDLRDGIVLVVDKYVSGSDGYIVWQVGELQYMECWGKIHLTIADGREYQYTLPNGKNYGNTNWSLQLGWSGGSDCAEMYSPIRTGNGFSLWLQSYSNRAYTVDVWWKSSGFIAM